jgi:lysylphosphatidylglycerol synthetase-like protein (DUF2156 family)
VNPLPSFPGVHERKSTFKPIVITLLCSFLLAGGSCFGALMTFNLNGGEGGTSWFAFMALFLAATLAFAVASVWLMVRAVLSAIRKKE